MEKQEGVTRSGFIDFIKGVSIIGVFIIHVILLIPPGHDYFMLGQFIDVLFRFAVPVFIGVLGYMTYKKYINIDNWSVFIKSKFLILGVPYILWSIVYLYFVPNHYYIPKTDIGLFSGIFLGDAEVHLYFMIAYFLFILLTPSIVAVLKSFSRRFMSKILLLISMLHLLYIAIMENVLLSRNTELINNTFYIVTEGKLPIHWLIYYCSGVVLAMYIKKFSSWLKRNELLIRFSVPIIVLLNVLLIVVLLITNRSQVIYFSPYLYPITLSAVILLFIFYKTLFFEKANGYIAYLGKNTFQFYLSHILFIKVVFIYVFNSDITIINLMATFILSFIMTIIYTILYNRFINYPKKRRRS
ncbi:surface polysaccharide O-acyltransferase-like enzyme [Evansella vedderi]|uniref:Surface polysaccharide O-acyltransferase-like enzyme n=1 Tax=Evansella vedderi TaxID=38282 RepID=A0ABT9ZZZ1_9BACI|nr:acyltransferase [Evansella vedderi]MDQ0255655.1 surface polysaccharide O-acyltransferase-like enzyme [Evansella vedderi]